MPKPAASKKKEPAKKVTASGKRVGRPSGRKPKGKHALPKKSPELKAAKKPVQGRPEEYTPLHDERAFRLAFLGTTDLQMAEAFQINEQTLYNWKIEHPSFLEAINKAKGNAVDNVRTALYHRAIGYSHPSEEISVSFGQVTRVPTVKHYPPDTAAAFIYLKNVDPKNWRDKREVGFTDEEGHDRDVTIFKLPDNERKDNTASEES